MTLAGFRLVRGALDRKAQEGLCKAIANVVREAPYFVPRMPRTGRASSVRMTNCGPLGWVTDKDNGYRYQATHPETERPWPAMPRTLIVLWEELSGFAAPPEACLVNYYAPGARLGSHRDADEEEARAPVLSISLGDDAVFHIGGLERGDPKTRLVLHSGDIVVLGGAARGAYHGIDRIVAGTSDLLPQGGRINLTLRRVTRIDD
jgi:alkylated DNA repair protein (DNA oxidative demethylase)